MNVDQGITMINTKEDDANTIITEEFEYDEEERKDPHANGAQTKKPKF